MNPEHKLQKAGSDDSSKQRPEEKLPALRDPFAHTQDVGGKEIGATHRREGSMGLAQDAAEKAMQRIQDQGKAGNTDVQQITTDEGSIVKLSTEIWFSPHSSVEVEKNFLEEREGYTVKVRGRTGNDSSASHDIEIVRCPQHPSDSGGYALLGKHGLTPEGEEQVLKENYIRIPESKLRLGDRFYVRERSAEKGVPGKILDRGWVVGIKEGEPLFPGRFLCERA